VLLWFAGMSVLIVWHVFRDPAFDYPLVMAGAIVPDVVGRPAHSLVCSAAVLVAVMAATRGRRLLRRRLLAVPIGMFLHLVLDGMWARTGVFWWPLPVGSSSWRWRGLPSLDRPVGLVVAEEVAGAVALLWYMRMRRSEVPC
jgi:LexA-binding, inner membrane-associated putative hydrolase